MLFWGIRNKVKFSELQYISYASDLRYFCIITHKLKVTENEYLVMIFHRLTSIWAVLFALHF